MGFSLVQVDLEIGRVALGCCAAAGGCRVWDVGRRDTVVCFHTLERCVGTCEQGMQRHPLVRLGFHAVHLSVHLGLRCGSVQLLGWSWDALLYSKLMSNRLPVGQCTHRFPVSSPSALSHTQWVGSYIVGRELQCYLQLTK